MRVDTGHNRQTAALPRVAVYDGRERCGDVQECSDGSVARDRHGNFIGTFPTQDAAATACWCAWHGQELVS